MPPSSLLNNLNSDWIKAVSALQPKGAAPRVLVYVESDEDIAFWRNVLADYKHFGVNFEINLPSDNFAKGKLQVLALQENTGPNLILCVDSDLDYLLDGHSGQSKAILENPFIFQTYTYSIENYFCFAPSLHQLCVQATLNDRALLDFEEVMGLYSKVIYELFLWLVHLEANGDHATLSISNFDAIVRILLAPMDVITALNIALDELKSRVDAKVAELERMFPHTIMDVRSTAIRLEALGLTSESTYLFAKGHTILTNVVLSFLRPVCETLHLEKLASLKGAALPVETRNQLLSKQKNARLSIDKLIHANTEFKSCFLYLKIKADLDQYFKAHNAVIHTR